MIPMGRARVWFAATALAALAGVVIQLPVTAGIHNGFFASATARTLNVFAFFTIESNLIVAATCLVLAVRPALRRHRRRCGGA